MKLLMLALLTACLLLPEVFAISVKTDVLNVEPPLADDQPATPATDSCEVVRAVTENNAGEENLERTVKCTCKNGMIAGTTREKPACVPGSIFEKKNWCDMNPCLENETCQVLDDLSGWLCDNGVQTKKVVVKQDDNSDQLTLN